MGSATGFRKAQVQGQVRGVRAQCTPVPTATWRAPPRVRVTTETRPLDRLGQLGELEQAACVHTQARAAASPLAGIGEAKCSGRDKVQPAGRKAHLNGHPSSALSRVSADPAPGSGRAHRRQPLGARDAAAGGDGGDGAVDGGAHAAQQRPAVRERPPVYLAAEAGLHL